MTITTTTSDSGLSRAYAYSLHFLTHEEDVRRGDDLAFCFVLAGRYIPQLDVD
jgi:hypothetical protein